MPKTANQKQKLLCLMRLLQEQTDENHPMTVPQMIDALARQGISAERKSVYDDLEALRIFGLDIACAKGKCTGYFISSRCFELPELKLLADAVAASKFITEKKSAELIRKIEGLSSVHEGRQLQRQVYVRGRVKTMNEKIYYNVDAIHQAIAQNRQIAFRYFEYTLHKTKRFRQDGQKYCVSPYALSWEDENYYLIAHYEKHANLSHFRVDKMEGIELREESCVQQTAQGAFDPVGYTKKVFHMYGGEEERLQLRFDNSLIGVVLDRFGAEVTIHLVDAHSFVVYVDACVSPTLLGWIFSFGDKVTVLSPERVTAQLRQMARACAAQYE